MTEPRVFELSVKERVGFKFPKSDVPNYPLPDLLRRESLPLPEVSEIDVVRHFTRLSQKNYAIDLGFYPLGSCTMKYNPKINEVTARRPGVSLTHPHQPIDTSQGNLYLLFKLQEYLMEISGFSGITLQPAAGAQGELVGALIIRKYHLDNGNTHRTKMLIPDSAHGTNPATSAMAGFDVIPLPSDEHGNVDINALKELCDDQLAGLMLTNPNTLGLFDENILSVINILLIFPINI